MAHRAPRRHWLDVRVSSAGLGDPRGTYRRKSSCRPAPTSSFDGGVAAFRADGQAGSRSHARKDGAGVRRPALSSREAVAAGPKRAGCYHTAWMMYFCSVGSLPELRGEGTPPSSSMYDIVGTSAERIWGQNAEIITMTALLVERAISIEACL